MSVDDLVAFATSVGHDVFDGTERIPSDVERARAACAELLAKPNNLDDEIVWQLLLSSAALTGEDGAAFLMSELADNEAGAECPQCKRASRLNVDDDKVWLESDAGSGDPSTRDAFAKLPAEIVRLAALARTAGHGAIAATLELLDSRVQCPSCRAWSPAIETLDALR